MARKQQTYPALRCCLPYTPPAIGSVPPGGLSEVFNYTITDNDGDTSAATLTVNVSDSDLDSTWNQIICDYPPHRIELLKDIQDTFITDMQKEVERAKGEGVRRGREPDWQWRPRGFLAR